MKNKSGFTLIELLVAMTIFLIVIAVVSSVFIKSLRTQKNITALIAANDNASLTLEQMTREIRTGRNFCGGDFCPSVSEIFFTNAHNEKVTYKLENDTIKRQAVDPLTGSGEFYAVTAKNIKVGRLIFNVDGSSLTDSQPTRVTIILGIKIRLAGASAETSVTNLQTTVTARNFNKS